MSWVVAIAGIVALVILHELGHFAAAKAVGMRVERFSLFFPPRIAGIQRGETDYAIGAIPFGGYVKITGMTPQEVAQRDLPPEVAARAYCNQPAWKRVVVIAAGPGVNVVIAFVVFWTVLLSNSVGGHLLIGDLGNVATLVPTGPALVDSVDRGSVAAGALRPGDRLVSIDGVPARIDAVPRLIAAHRCSQAPVAGCVAAQPARIVVVRGGHTLTFSLAPRYDAVVKRMRLGVSTASAGVQALPFGVLAAARVSLQTMWQTTTQTVTRPIGALTSSKTRAQLSSIIGVTVATHTAVAAGGARALVVIAYISLALGIINLFPFLPLDGGHIVWALGEKLRGRRISMSAMARYSSVGIVALLFLVVSAMANDISGIANGTIG